MRYLTTKQAAAEMGVSPQTVLRWINTRGLKAHDIGVSGRPRMRIKADDLDAWVKDPNKAA